MEKNGKPTHSEGTHCVHSQFFSLTSKRKHQFATITDLVQRVITESGIQHGEVKIKTLHTTAGVWVNEDEKNLIGADHLTYTPDMVKVLKRFANEHEEWKHNDIRDVDNPEGVRDTHLCPAQPDGTIPECRNAEAHAQSMVIKHETGLFVIDGKLVKGHWQQIMFVELDHDRPRQFIVQVSGIK